MRKTLAFLLVGLLGIVVVFLLYGLIATGNPEFFARTLMWLDSDVQDYQKFPAREIENAAPVFHFQKSGAPCPITRVDYTYDDQPQSRDLETFLRETGTQAFLAIHDDTLLCEFYPNGYTRDSIVTSFSVAKSFDSTLIGIAIDEGLIGSVNDRVMDYIPEIRGRGLDELTIKHLLTMSTAIHYTEADAYFPLLAFLSDDARTYYHPNLREVALSVRRSDEPFGAQIHYNNYHPLLEGMILERVTKMPVAKYLQEKIWKPLGMEFPASWSLDSEQSGFEKMESGINGRAIDFAKFGRLFLRNGNWNGKQIVSEEWVRQATAPDPADKRPWPQNPYWTELGGYYQYHWWGLRRADGTYDYMARGKYAQSIFVSPAKNVVLVRFGEKNGAVDAWANVFTDMANAIVP